MNSLFASLRLATLVLCTLCAFGFFPVPFTFGATAQLFYPRRLPPSAAVGLGTAAFLIAWLALDDVPLAFSGRTSASFWPLWAVSWLFSMAGCQYAIFLVRALWPGRFARQPLLAVLSPQAGHAELAPVAGPNPRPAAAGIEPLGLQDLRVTMRALRFWFRAIKRSVFAFAATLIIGFASMGLLGAVLYYPVAPVLQLQFASQDTWHGDWVWPAVINAGMAWAAGFLIAGVVNYFLGKRRLRASLRCLIYLGVLWLWDLVVWTLTLVFAPSHPPL